MPTSTFWSQRQLEQAVNSTALNRTRLVDMATRIVATFYQFGQDGALALGDGMPPNLLLEHNYTDVKDPAARPNLLQQAIEGHVLVKNVNGALPLKSPKVLSIFGHDAVVQNTFNPDGQLFPQSWEFLGLGLPQAYEIASNAPVESPPQVKNGTLIVGGGSGSNTPAYISSPYDAIQARAYEDGTTLFYDFTSVSPNIVQSSDACLVFINEVHNVLRPYSIYVADRSMKIAVRLRSLGPPRPSRPTQRSTNHERRLRLQQHHSHHSQRRHPLSRRLDRPPKHQRRNICPPPRPRRRTSSSADSLR